VYIALSERISVSVAGLQNAVRMRVNRAHTFDIVRLHICLDGCAHGVRHCSGNHEHVRDDLPIAVETEFPRIIRAEKPHVLVRVALLAGLENELHSFPGDPQQIA
jgi:hypothetical protein